MNGIAQFLRRLWLLVRRERFRSELDEEMAFHRAQAERDFVAGGMTPNQARHAAIRQFGNAVKLREQSHETVHFRWESLGQDARYALRQMLRAPGFTLAVILTLALGIGATTAIFTVVHATLLRPLPYPGAERIVSIRDEKLQGISTGGLVAVPRFYDLLARNHSFEALTFFYFEDTTLVIGTHMPEHMSSVGTSAQFWRVFGVQPLLGRVYDEREDKPQASGSVVLSYAAWQRLFGGNPNAIGRTVTVDKQPASIVGVMPQGFAYPARIEMWRAAQFDPGSWKNYRGDGTRFINVFGRLKPGITLASAQSELTVLGDQMASEHSDTDARWRFTSSFMRDYIYGSLRPALLILLAASFLLLLIGCVNVANLLLSRATAREREVALRQVLGASRIRIMRQLLTESLLMALLGGGAGVSLTYVFVHWAGTRLPGAFRSQGGIAMDWPVAGFALVVSIAVGVLFGVAPAIQIGGGELNRGLKAGETRMAGAAGNSLRSAFIAVQVGLSLMLLVGACLLTQSLWNLIRSPLGFAPDHLLVFKVELPWEGKPASTNAFFGEAQRRIEALPGVAATGQISALPTVDWHARTSYDTDWLPRTSHHDAVNVEARHMYGDYLGAMDIPLLAGRALRVNDGAVVLVNQEFVHRYLPGGNPVGKHLVDPSNQGANLEIVGVIGNVRGTSGSIANDVLPEVYYPAASLNTRWFVVRSFVPPEQLTEAVRKIVHDVDPQQSIGNVGTMDERLNTAVAQPRLNMALLASFAGIALLLACVGIYGVVAYSVAQRRQEIGVRMALGATRRQISLLFLRRTLTAALIGLGAGSIAALMLTRLLRSQLYGVSPNNLGTFALAIALLLIPVLLASLRPALLAASVDPMEALRTE